jgi:hypothetical protein
MKVVAENADEEHRVQEAQERTERALVELAANLLRVVRGAGRPYDIAQHSHDFLAAMKAYYATKGKAPFEPFREATLSVRRDVPSRDFGASESFRAHAQDMVVRGALQIAASRLLGQAAQEAAGRAEMQQGIRDLAEANKVDAAVRRKASVAEPQGLPGVVMGFGEITARRGRPRKGR